MATIMTAGDASPSPPPPPPEPPAQRLATELYVDKRIAELESKLTWRLLGIAAAIVAAGKLIPPAY